MTPLGVAMFSESYLPRISGVVQSVASFSRALRREGHRVVIVAPTYRGYVDDDPDVIRLPSVVTRGQPDFPLAVPFRYRLFRDLRSRGVDVVHAHTPFIMGRLGQMAARRLRVPLIFSHHTLYHEYVHYVPWVRPDLSRRIILRYTRAFANRCDLVIAPSRVVRDLLRTEGVGTEIRVLPTGGVDPEVVYGLDRGAGRRRYAIPADAPLIITVSRLAPEKNVDAVLRAFQQVARASEAYLLIVGGGPSIEPLRALAAELDIDARTRFAGPVPHSEAMEAIAGADLFLFASATETHGLVLVEALAAGVPVVAVARGGAAEVVREGEVGFLVEPEPQALARAALAVLGDPSRRAAMSRRAREVAVEYTTASLAARLAFVYESVVQAKAVNVPHRT